MMRNSKGFTLIEIAIVLVIIGLLLGGVLKGQELITGARVRNLISQQDGIKAAFFGFQDRYRALPGDYASASANIKCTGICMNGNGNGRIEQNASGDREDIIAWSHLTAAGFLNGSYSPPAAPPPTLDANAPKNPYSIYLQIVYDAVYGRHPCYASTGEAQPQDGGPSAGRDHRRGRPQDRRRQTYSGAFQFSVIRADPGCQLHCPARHRHGHVHRRQASRDLGHRRRLYQLRRRQFVLN